MNLSQLTFQSTSFFVLYHTFQPLNLSTSFPHHIYTMHTHTHTHFFLDRFEYIGSKKQHEKMEGYTKINGNNTSNNKSRSTDFSDLQSFPQPHKTNENLSPNHTTVHEVQIKNIDLESISKNQHSKSHETHDENENENEDGIANDGKMKGNNTIPAGVKLSRACSVSAAATANRFRLERQGSKRSTTTSFQSVKRVFSMRRSSSVSEKYCRIHDQGFTISSPVLDDVAEANEGMEIKKKKSGSGRILKACKRLFGI